MKYAIYVRTSTRDKQSPDMQLKQLKDYADMSGYAYDVFTEQESTRKTRPIKQKVLNSLRKREYIGVIVYKLDRWGRSTSELVNELEELHSKNIKFISLQDNIDMGTASGIAFVGMLAVFAQFERDITRERVLDGLEVAKSKGKQLGRPKGSKDKKVRRKSGYYQRYTEE